MITLQGLEVFLRVVGEGSFSKAAHVLNVSQPTVSQTIQNLEAYFDAVLFERHRRGVYLTDAGEALLPMAHELVASARRLEEDMAILHGLVVGKLVIGCSTSAGKYLLPRSIARFQQQFPRVRVDIKIRSRESALEKLITNQVDLAVSSKRIEHGDVEYIPLFKDEVVLITPTDHPWAQYGRVLPEDLRDAPMILREPESGSADSLIHGLRQHDITPDMLNVVMELGNPEAIVMAVEEGIGVSFVSRLVAQRGIVGGKIAIVEVERMPLEHQIYIGRNLSTPFSRSQAEFWTFIAEQKDEIVVQERVMEG